MPVFLLHALQQKVPALLVFRIDVAKKRLPDEPRALLVEQAGSGEIGGDDLPFAGQRKIANRGKVVEIKIKVAGCLQIDCRLPQGLVLHLQFNRINVILMLKLIHGQCGHRAAIADKLRLGGGSQLFGAGAFFPNRFFVHGFPRAPSWSVLSK